MTSWSVAQGIWKRKHVVFTPEAGGLFMVLTYSLRHCWLLSSQIITHICHFNVLHIFSNNVLKSFVCWVPKILKIPQNWKKPVRKIQLYLLLTSCHSRTGVFSLYLTTNKSHLISDLKHQIFDFPLNRSFKVFNPHDRHALIQYAGFVSVQMHWSRSGINHDVTDPY